MARSGAPPTKGTRILRSGLVPEVGYDLKGRVWVTMRGHGDRIELRFPLTSAAANDLGDKLHMAADMAAVAARRR